MYIYYQQLVICDFAYIAYYVFIKCLRYDFSVTICTVITPLLDGVSSCYHFITDADFKLAFQEDYSNQFHAARFVLWVNKHTERQTIL